jgi:hypothetical protein
VPRLTFSQSVAAGATFNPFSGWQYEYLPWRARVRAMAWTTAVGMLQSAVTGSESIQVESPLDIGGAAAGNLPTVFDVDPLDFVAPPGDRVTLNFRNTTGAALNVMGVIDVNPA